MLIRMEAVILLGVFRDYHRDLLHCLVLKEEWGSGSL